MMKELFQKIPLWFLLIWIVVMTMIIFNMFQSNSTFISTLAIVIINVANAIRIWKDQRPLAKVCLAVAAFCFIVLFKTW